MEKRLQSLKDLTSQTGRDDDDDDQRTPLITDEGELKPEYVAKLKRTPESLPPLNPQKEFLVREYFNPRKSPLRTAFGWSLYRSEGPLQKDLSETLESVATNSIKRSNDLSWPQQEFIEKSSKQLKEQVRYVKESVGIYYTGAGIISPEVETLPKMVKAISTDAEKHVRKSIDGLGVERSRRRKALKVLTDGVATNIGTILGKDSELTQTETKKLQDKLKKIFSKNAFVQGQVLIALHSGSTAPEEFSLKIQDILDDSSAQEANLEVLELHQSVNEALHEFIPQKKRGPVEDKMSPFLADFGEDELETAKSKFQTILTDPKSRSRKHLLLGAGAMMAYAKSLEDAYSRSTFSKINQYWEKNVRKTMAKSIVEHPEVQYQRLEPVQITVDVLNEVTPIFDELVLLMKQYELSLHPGGIGYHNVVNSNQYFHDVYYNLGLKFKDPRGGNTEDALHLELITPLTYGEKIDPDFTEQRLRSFNSFLAWILESKTKHRKPEGPSLFVDLKTEKEGVQESFSEKDFFAMMLRYRDTLGSQLLGEDYEIIRQEMNGVLAKVLPEVDVIAILGKSQKEKDEELISEVVNSLAESGADEIGIKIQKLLSGASRSDGDQLRAALMRLTKKE